MIIFKIILIWLGIAGGIAWYWHRLRAHGKRREEEMDKWTGKEE
jgi:hypothetical protein